MSFTLRWDWQCNMIVSSQQLGQYRKLKCFSLVHLHFICSVLIYTNLHNHTHFKWITLAQVGSWNIILAFLEWMTIHTKSKHKDTIACSEKNQTHSSWMQQGVFRGGHFSFFFFSFLSAWKRKENRAATGKKKNQKEKIKLKPSSIQALYSKWEIVYHRIIEWFELKGALKII